MAANIVVSRELKLDLRVRGIMTSKHMHLANGEVSLQRWRETI